MKNTYPNGEQQTQPKSLSLTAWIFTRCLLWNLFEFSEEEARKAQGQILSLLTSCGDARKDFVSFCQRVVLAQQYLSRHEHCYLPLPTEWLHPGNEQGFAGTRNWLRRIENARASIPGHR